MPNLSSLANIPGYGAYIAKRQMNEQAGIQDLQEQSLLMGLKEKMKAQQQEQELKTLFQQSGGNLEAVVQGALKAGRPDIAAKLAPLVAARQRATPQNRVVPPGAKVLGPDNQVVFENPRDTPRPTAPAGYRFTADGSSLEAIPGGPAAKPAAQRNAPSGYRWGEIGNLEPIPGGPAAPRDTGFTADALDLRARQYLSGDSKAFANLGRGAQGRETIVAITNRAAQLLREQGGSPEEIGRRLAEFKANSASLSKLTQNYDAVTAFEQTAVRNGKILKDLANKVDATGVPAAERWIRAGRRAVAGDPDVSAFHAQLQVYRTEAARILTNPNLGGHLTDSARHEMEEFLKGDASGPQITRVVDLLETDFANRKKTLEEQMRAIRVRLEKNISAGEAPKKKERIKFDAQGNEVQ